MKKSSLLTLAALAACTASWAGTPNNSSCNVWKPAASCNYTVSSRPSSYPIQYVVIHKAEGSAASAASWFQNCAAAGSAHYAFDNNNGYCYQMVYEKDIAWHAGYSSTNQRSIGIEHGGYTASNDVQRACYDASALETRAAIQRYGVPFDRSHIIGHSQVPGCSTPGGGGTGCHTDPGAYWDWNYYMTRCNPNTGASGNRVAMARTADGRGYWIAAKDGGVFCFGNAGFYGSLPGLGVNVSNIVAMAARPQGDGYWLVGSDGGVFCFGNAPFRGSMGGQPLNQPVVGIACTADGNGYWLVGKDGGIFAFNAPYQGSVPGAGVNVTNIVGIASTPANGYWCVGSDGGIYSFGAGFYGSMGGQHLNAPVKAMAPAANGDGYWMVAGDGGIFTFGAAGYAGNYDAAMVSIARGPSNGGYWCMTADGAIYSFGDVSYYGGANF